MIERWIGVLRSPLDAERRSILPIQILMRWTLVATALLIIVWEPRSSGASYVGLVAIVVGAAALNAWMHWRLARGEPIAVGLPTLAGVYDAVAITAGLRIVEGFDNLNFALYYPALLALTIVFPGRWSLLYAGATMAAHSVLVTTHSSFDWGSSQDVKDLGVRLITVAVVVAIANLAVSIERRLRARAVGAAVAAHAERQRVSREIHDGVAQGVYMLAVNLEANTKVIERQTDDEALQQRMRALVRLSKQTLLETRGLLIDMGPAFAGEEGLASLLEHHASEFSAVTGIPVRVETSGDDPQLPPATVGELYRVLQEGLANVYKHADAHEAQLRLAHTAGSVTLEVVDDGRGFEPGVLDGPGHGLANVRERAELLGGELVVESAPGRGTRLALTIPVPAMGTA